MTKWITLQHKKNDTCISFFLFLTIIRLHIKIVIREITIQQKKSNRSAILDNNTGKRYFLMSITLNVYVKLNTML